MTNSLAPCLLALALLLSPATLPASTPDGPATAAPNAALPWQKFTPELFQRARQADKPVFLYVEAVWCHWCHVMQRKTFTDAAVQQRLAQHWLLTRVDHDANPLVANRYRDYGWPALVFFNAQGQEVVKRAGFIGPEAFLALLEAIERDPTPEAGSVTALPPSTGVPVLAASTRKRLAERHLSSYDPVHGGLKTAQKYLERDSVAYDLRQARAGNPKARARLRQTLDAAVALIDPVWGGMYQYSTHGDWAHPHFEKIMRTQSRALLLYTDSYAAFKQPQDASAAKAIRDYLLNFLQAPDAGFYVSQDADVRPGEHAAGYYALDDAARRAIGVPRIDRNRYAQENGQAMEALARYAEVFQDAVALAAAERAAAWVLAKRQNTDGSYQHGEASDGPYLGDSLAMARGLLALAEASGKADYRQAAKRTATALDARFRGDGSGFVTASALGAVVEPPRTIEDNMLTARLFLSLAAGEPTASAAQPWLAAADHALAWLFQPEVALAALTEVGVLLVADERSLLRRRFGG